MDTHLEPSVSNIIRTYMTAVGGKQISLRRFVTELNEPLESKGLPGLTHQAIYNWLIGKNKPSKRVLTLLRSASVVDTWQYNFANDLNLFLSS